ncbi:hypothetical protein PV11_07928 [Exophiala sideris]|uniref:Uncharacterized protein n=1 Tax=Exophiala sideris TaxID=1016849 RepID=A0A0D1VW08_9EURO|nr:hypothetical protein PV11_07928 [Exophiala sideris]
MSRATTWAEIEASRPQLTTMTIDSNDGEYIPMLANVTNGHLGDEREVNKGELVSVLHPGCRLDVGSRMLPSAGTFRGYWFYTIQYSTFQYPDLKGHCGPGRAARIDTMKRQQIAPVQEQYQELEAPSASSSTTLSYSTAYTMAKLIKQNPRETVPHLDAATW